MPRIFTLIKRSCLPTRCPSVSIFKKNLNLGCPKCPSPSEGHFGHPPLLISPALTPKARVVLPPSRTVTTTRLLRRPKHLVRLSLFKYALQFEHASGNDAQMLHPSTIKSLTREHYILHGLIQLEFKSALLCFMTEINFDTEETLTILNTLHH